MSKSKYYPDEENALLLVSLLKEHSITHVVASPGTTNSAFVASLQRDNYFTVYSSVDERSAAYLACGMCAELGKPVVILAQEPLLQGIIFQVSLRPTTESCQFSQ